MLRLARLRISRTALTSKVALGGKAFYTDHSTNFATILARTNIFLNKSSLVGGSKYSPDDRCEPPRLEERSFKVVSVKQKGSIYSVSATFGQSKLLEDYGDYPPPHHVHSWDLPSLAVKAAKAYFAEVDRSHDYSCSFQLKPVDDRFNRGLTYFITHSFSQNDAEHFLVKQQYTCQSTPDNHSRSKIEAPVEISIDVLMLWLSPQGSSTLTIEELGSVAESISKKGVDLLEPLEAAFIVAQRDFGAQVGFRPDRAVNICHDVLDKYTSQLPALRLEVAKFTSIDKPLTRYVVQAPAHHLGQQYVRTGNFHRALIAFGSNIGDRAKNVEESLHAMSRKGIKVRSTSFIYETEAMYYEQQDPFLNGVCEIETSLEPLALLDVLQKIEMELGRVKLIDKGPRTIDLDILLYDFDNIQHPRLQIPHKLMLEREFVLRPLTDIIAAERLPPPHNKLSILAYLEELVAFRLGEAPSVISNLGSRLPLTRPNDPTRDTRIMAVLNITPDSFSDGGKYMTSQLDAVESDVRRFIAEGASIIDVGGQSTRPGATRIPWQEELERVCPAIERIRSMPEARNVAISVDTFYADVARGAVAAGADIINDVSGGMLDSRMLPLIADLQVSIVLMHMRGTPGTMADLTSYPDGVVEGVAKELLERVADAQKAGIPRWRIVLDPGIGFAKTQAQNLELLRNLESLRRYPGLRDFPWLVGTSRKNFIGRITGVSAAAERGWGTAATVTTSIAGGADIVRVHDLEMSQVVKMADAMYRVKSKRPEVSAAVKVPEDLNTDAGIKPENSYLSTGVSPDGD